MRLSENVKIVLGFVALACALGLALDMVTAHVAVEYFTVHHPRVVASESPIVMALVWGIIASWWFGAIAGGILAFINSRRERRLRAAVILRKGALGVALLWLFAMMILTGVYLISEAVPISKRRPTFEHDRRLVAVAVTHSTEYLTGGIALVLLGIFVARTKRDNL